MPRVKLGQAKGIAMSVTVYIPNFMSPLINNVTEVETTGSTVGQCLQVLIAKYPRLRTRLFTNGKFNDRLDIYLNGKSTYPMELATPVRDGDEIRILYPISGG
jgi:MoaD family protein